MESTLQKTLQTIQKETPRRQMLYGELLYFRAIVPSFGSPKDQAVAQRFLGHAASRLNLNGDMVENLYNLTKDNMAEVFHLMKAGQLPQAPDKVL